MKRIRCIIKDGDTVMDILEATLTPKGNIPSFIIKQLSLRLQQGCSASFAEATQ